MRTYVLYSYILPISFRWLKGVGEEVISMM